MLFIFGGIIGSIVAALIYFGLFFVINLSTVAGIYVYEFLLSGFSVSFITLVFSLIPLKIFESSDIITIKNLIKKDVKSRLTVIILAILGQVLSGLSPSQVSENFYFNVPVDEDKSPENILFLNFLGLYYLDKMDFESYKKTILELERLEDYIPDDIKQTILPDIFFNRVFNLGDIEKGKEIYLRLEKPKPSKHNIVSLRIQMTYELFILENPKLAIATGKNALLLKNKHTIIGEAIMEGKIINLLTKKAEKNCRKRVRKYEWFNSVNKLQLLFKN